MIYPSLWLKENAEMRDELAKIFDIRKSGGIEVTGGILVSDGRKPIDLLNITIEKMQKFLGSKEKDENVLWSLCVDKVKQNLEPFPNPSDSTQIFPPINSIMDFDK